MEDDEDIDSGSLTYLYFDNSWFGSGKPASNVGITDNHCWFRIKTTHSRSLKFWLEGEMKDMIGSTWIALEGKPEKEGIDVICIG